MCSIEATGKNNAKSQFTETMYAATKFQQLSNNNEGVRGMKTIKALKLMNEVSHTFLLSPTGS